MNNPNPKVDGYIRKNKPWSAELQALRAILLDSELTEDVKWRVPCYTLDGANVIILGAFKQYCGFSFLKGVLLKDPKKILAAPGENSQSVRLIRFTDTQQIAKLKPTLKSYIAEAIAIERSGQKVPLKKISERPIPEELEAKFQESPELKKAFQSLTPGRQRAYLLLFSSAKQPQTRTARIEKHTPRILSGKGLDD